MTTSGPSWGVIPETPLGAHLQMAVDEVLLEAVAAEGRGPLLRFWGWSEAALVLGSNQSVRNELDLEATSRRGFTIARRLSGGGTMLAEPGNTITWSLYLPQTLVAGMGFRESYRLLDGFAVEALRRLGIDAGYQPINDIVSPHGKIAGAAQARRRGAVLHHTTMAFSMRPGLVSELIRIGRPDLGGRGVRSAEKTVTPVSELLPGLARESVVAALREEFEAVWPVAGETALQVSEEVAARNLARSKYARREWIERLP